MKVRWLGNACIEVFGGRHILIDPNCVKEPEEQADVVLISHEHDDHFSHDTLKEYGSEAELFGPGVALEKFDLAGRAVKPGDRIGDIRVLESRCWGSDESVSFYYRGLLHSGDSADFPEAEKVKLIFTACFPDFYRKYLAAFRRLKPDLVVPFHYDPGKNNDEAEELVRLLEKEGVPSRLVAPGESIDF